MDEIARFFTYGKFDTKPAYSFLCNFSGIARDFYD
jgi:hypothetical protein